MAAYPYPHSTEQQNSTSGRNILSGWKDIANYLGKGVRTVQRYERELRLPIRRPAGRHFGSVIATCSDLDEWVSASPKSFDKMRLDFQRLSDLRRGTIALHQLCAEGQKFTAAVVVQRVAVASSIERITKTLAGPASPKGEKHLAIAAAQTARAAEMIDRVREMSDQAKEMRKPHRRRLVVNC